MMWPLRTLAFAAGAGVLLLASAIAAQEHSYTPADIENGARLYQSSCAGCHGPTGDSVPGIELGRGPFRRASSDPELVAIIRNGIPGTTMPPSSFSETQAFTIVAYLRSMAPASGPNVSGGDVVGGDATRGKSLFDGKGQCARCHRVNGAGPRVAPDLTDVGAIRRAPELRQKLLDPNAAIRPGNRFIQAVTTDGVTITGRLLNQDSFSIQLIDSSERLVSLPKASLREYGFVKSSPMPSYRDKLASDELTDLVAYLVSLKGLRP
jgi:putative heme-binding domain-containing protein